MDYEIAHFGYKTGTIGSFLHPYESDLPSNLVLTTRIIRAFPLP